jgi:hypothetical protein
MIGAPQFTECQDLYQGTASQVAENPEPQISHRRKSVRDEKNRDLLRRAKATPLQKRTA